MRVFAIAQVGSFVERQLIIRLQLIAIRVLELLTGQGFHRRRKEIHVSGHRRDNLRNRREHF